MTALLLFVDDLEAFRPTVHTNVTNTKGSPRLVARRGTGKWSTTSGWTMFLTEAFRRPTCAAFSRRLRPSSPSGLCKVSSLPERRVFVRKLALKLVARTGIG